MSLPPPVNGLISLLARQAVKGYFTSQTQQPRTSEPDRSKRAVQISPPVDYAE